MVDLRSTQQVVEALSSSEPDIRSTQQVLEILYALQPPTRLRSTQQVIETVYSADNRLRSTQQVVEVVYTSGTPGGGDIAEGNDGTDAIYNLRGIINYQNPGGTIGHAYQIFPSSGTPPGSTTDSIADLNTRLSNRVSGPRYYGGDAN